MNDGISQQTYLFINVWIKLVTALCSLSALGLSVGVGLVARCWAE